MLEALFEALFVGIWAATGEIILWLVMTRGRKPFQPDKHGDWPMLIGVIFWVLIILIIAMIFIL